jgi:glutaredoxin
MSLAVMFDLVRTSIHRAITTPVGDAFLPVRLPKDLARRFNSLLGDPICSKEELERRRAGQAKLEELKKNGGRSKSGAVEIVEAVQAPMMVYFEKDRNARMFGRMQEMLDAKRIKYTLLDVTTDATTKNFVLREAKCKDDDLPIVFVSSTPIGGYNELVDWDVSGRLAKALAGQ